jgi:hypothetical protein
MKKEESSSRQERWERIKNEMKNRKTSVSWQNDTLELSRREQVIMSSLMATHQHIIEKTDPPNCLFCDVRPTTKETNAASNAQYGSREEKAARNWLNTSVK